MGIGGCIASIASWRAFAYEWEEHLALWDLDFFHMKDAESKKGAYKNWTDLHRNSRVGILARLIERAVICNVGVVLPPDLLGNMVTEKIRAFDPDMAATEGHPYFFAFRHVIESINRVCVLRKLDRHDVEIVFAEQDHIGPRVRDSWRESLREEGYQEPVFRSPQKLSPLQAADMVAWFLRRRFDRPDEIVRPRHTAIARRLMYSPATPDVIRQLAEEFDKAREEVDNKIGDKDR